MSKKFKLVYEDKGIIKGSYTGIPADGDEALIERAILEGSKPVPPAPEPGPSPEEPIEVSIDEFISVLESLCISEEYPLEYDQDYVCHVTGTDLVNRFEDLDADFLKWFIEDCATPWISVFGWDLEQLAENALGVAGILGEYSPKEIKYGPLFGFSVETDTETGDSWNVVSGWPEEKVVELKFNRHKQ